jgi:hypothetical protein
MLSVASPAMSASSQIKATAQGRKRPVMLSENSFSPTSATGAGIKNSSGILLGF